MDPLGTKQFHNFHRSSREDFRLPSQCHGILAAQAVDRLLDGKKNITCPLRGEYIIKRLLLKK